MGDDVRGLLEDILSLKSYIRLLLLLSSQFSEKNVRPLRIVCQSLRSFAQRELNSIDHIASLIDLNCSWAHNSVLYCLMSFSMFNYVSTVIYIYKYIYIIVNNHTVDSAA